MEFQRYVCSVLKQHHPGLACPDPMGVHGDWGADAVTADGSIVYACYGAQPNTRDADTAAADKLRSDFVRAVEQWPHMREWRFVTNAKTGPKTITARVELVRAHGPDSVRPLAIGLWKADENEDALWDNILRGLPTTAMDILYPGAPGRVDIELADILPLLGMLEDAADLTAEVQPIADPPMDKMDHNAIPAPTRAEFDDGRRYAPRIDIWYADPGQDPELRDRHGRRFQEIYQRHRTTLGSDAGGIVERIYEALAGPGFRAGDLRARTAAWAVTAYFFDQCDIFETPPQTGGDRDAAADQGRLF